MHTWLSFNGPSPTLVLQATNTGVGMKLEGDNKKV